MCMGRSSHLLRCLEPKMSGGFQAPSCQQTSSATYVMPPKYVSPETKCHSICWTKFSPSFSRSDRSFHASGFMNALLLVWVSSVTLLLKTKSRVRGVQIQPKFDAQKAVSFPVSALHDLPYGLSFPVKQEISQIPMKCQVSALF